MFIHGITFSLPTFHRADTYYPDFKKKEKFEVRNIIRPKATPLKKLKPGFKLISV